MSEDDKPRWQYRFDNYKRAFTLLREAIEIKNEREMTQLEKEGIIQRFEYTMELAWKTIKDYMEFQGMTFPEILPRLILKEAIAGNVIAHGQTWLDALDARNKMSHTYNFKDFEIIIDAIQDHYLQIFEDFYFHLLEKTVSP